MRTILAVVAVLCCLFTFAQAEPPLLLTQPTLSRTSIVFNYADDLWIVGRDGGEARRLTTAVGTETDPHFSPDGSMVAFTGEYDGNPARLKAIESGAVPVPQLDEIAWSLPRFGRTPFSFPVC